MNVMCAAAWLENRPHNSASDFAFMLKWDVVAATKYPFFCRFPV